MAAPERRRRQHGIDTRSSALSFLETAPPRIVELYRYWDRKRGNRPMPQRVDMAPEDFPLHLPGILLVDVEGLDQQGRGVFRYRVVGTREVRLRGHDPTGKLVQDGFFGLSAKDTIDRYEQVRRDRTLLYDPHEYYTQEGKWQEGVTLFLPISEDGETVSQVLVYAENRLPQPGDDLAGLAFSPLRAGND